jgi:hypothetical protein
VKALIFRAAGCRVFVQTCPKIPLFCPAADMASGLFLPRDWQNGEIAKMIIKASERLALVLAAGLLLASPVQAATDGDDSTSDSKSDSTAAPVTHRTFRHASHHRKHYAHHRPHVIATKTEADKKATDAIPDDNKVLPNIPPSIANANAQMLLANAQINAAAVIPAGSGAPAQAFDSQASGNRADASTDSKTFMVAADQLNDADRTLQEGSSTPAAAAGSPPATTVTGESTALDQTSLIGKIFIGFGALLTMASAARMFFT